MAEGRGRPAKENKSVQIGIRLSEEEKARIERAAAADYRTPSDWVRVAIMKALDKAEKEAAE